MRKLCIAVDFDGTIAESRWPEIGNEIPGAVATIAHLRRNGHRVIIWTCRTGKPLEDAIYWMQRHNLRYDAINANLREMVQKYGGDTRKVSADVYVDDKAVGLIGVDKRMLWARVLQEINRVAGR